MFRISRSARLPGSSGPTSSPRPLAKAAVDRRGDQRLGRGQPERAAGEPERVEHRRGRAARSGRRRSRAPAGRQARSGDGRSASPSRRRRPRQPTGPPSRRCPPDGPCRPRTARPAARSSRSPISSAKSSTPGCEVALSSRRRRRPWVWAARSTRQLCSSESAVWSAARVNSVASSSSPMSGSSSWVSRLTYSSAEIRFSPGVMPAARNPRPPSADRLR